jgi:hypothetical protein
MNAIADMTATRTAVLDEAHASHIQGIASREARVRHREHRSGTPNLLELGCLAVIAGLVSLLDKERVALFAKLTETAEELRDLGEITTPFFAVKLRPKYRARMCPHCWECSES